MTGAQWHQWTRWVLGSDSLTDAQKLVLLALQTFADYPAGTNARPGVATMAVACGLKERAVRYALEAGERLKLIEQTGPANPKPDRSYRDRNWKYHSCAHTAAADSRNEVPSSG